MGQTALIKLAKMRGKGQHRSLTNITEVYSQKQLYAYSSELHQ